MQLDRRAYRSTRADSDHSCDIRECHASDPSNNPPIVRYLSPQYIVCDSLLLFQIYYYRWKNPHTDEPTAQDINPSEDTPLLENSVGPKSTGLWSTESEVLKCSLYFTFVFAAGVLAWTIDSRIRGPRTPNEPEGVVEWRSQVLGWVSAAMFRTSSAVFDFAFCFTDPPTPLQWALVYHKSVSEA